MTDYKAMIEEHSCKPNQGCGVMTICMCGVAEDMADEIERLREALRMIADGDVPRQHVLIWRTDGQYSKHDKCPHEKWMYDDCDECVASFARAALGEGKG